VLLAAEVMYASSGSVESNRLTTSSQVAHTAVSDDLRKFSMTASTVLVCDAGERLGIGWL
jgi:hypothetical protein